MPRHSIVIIVELIKYNANIYLLFEKNVYNHRKLIEQRNISERKEFIHFKDSLSIFLYI